MKKIIMCFTVLFTAITVYSQVPDSPILVLPPEEASVVSLTPALEWQTVPGADCYFIYITTDTNIVPSTFNCMSTQNSYNIPSGILLYNKTYFWNVRAHNSSGWSSPSQYFKFTTVCATVEGSILNLISQVNNVVQEENLSFNQGNILNNRLEAAIHQLELNHKFVALLNMAIFKMRLYMLRYSEMIPSADANSLLFSADGVIDLIQTLSKPGTVGPELPDEFALRQNYPNPFNPVTTIEYSIPENANVTLKIYDLLGREITTLVDKYQQKGSYIINWNASNYSSGIYIYKLTSGNRTETRKLILSK